MMTKKTTTKSNPWGASYWPHGMPLPDSEGFKKLDWPADVPSLVAADICREGKKSGRKRPLSEWFELTFDEGRPAGDPVGKIAFCCILAVIARRAGQPLAIWEYNSDPSVSLETQADAWGEMLTLLGYEITGSSDSPLDQNFDEFFS